MDNVYMILYSIQYVLIVSLSSSVCVCCCCLNYFQFKKIFYCEYLVPIYLGEFPELSVINFYFDSAAIKQHTVVHLEDSSWPLVLCKHALLVGCNPRRALCSFLLFF